MSAWRGERDSWPFDSSFLMFFPPPGPALCKLGWPGVLFFLPEVLTQVLVKYELVKALDQVRRQ